MTLQTDLSSLGLESGDLVLVHSSLSKLGHVDGGSNTVIDSILEQIGPDGTMLVPTLTGSENLNKANPPVFDPETTPCWTGIIPETFRKRPEAKRSLHPTHSVAAIGPMADDLLKDHHLAKTPCGPDTPYYRLAQSGGKVLLMGVDLENCTLFHTGEELAESPYHLQPEKVDARITIEGKVVIQATTIHLYGTPRHFMVLDEALLKNQIMTKGKVLEATCRLINAGAFLEFALGKIKNNPKAFIQNAEQHHSP
jgi:aminoglycoside 3-N-acetyltransferase